jgi:hypothetical protein
MTLTSQLLGKLSVFSETLNLSVREYLHIGTAKPGIIWPLLVLKTSRELLPLQPVSFRCGKRVTNRCKNSELQLLITQRTPLPSYPRFCHPPTRPNLAHTPSPETTPMQQLLSRLAIHVLSLDYRPLVTGCADSRVCDTVFLLHISPRSA